MILAILTACIYGLGLGLTIAFELSDIEGHRRRLTAPGRVQLSAGTNKCKLINAVENS